MSQLTPTKNDTLLCTYGNCKEPQQEDGEYCKEHCYGGNYQRIFVELHGGHFCKEHGYTAKDEIDPCDIPF